MTMKDENLALPSNGEPGGRITRARAATFHASGALLPLKPLPPKPEKKNIQREKRKKDENNFAAPSAAFQSKKRAVLRDVTNMCCESSIKDCINAANVQAKVIRRVKSGPAKAKLCPDKKSVNFAPVVSVVSDSVLEDSNAEHIQEMKIFGSQETAMSCHVKDNAHASQNVESLMDGESICTTALFEDQDTSGGLELVCQAKRANCKLPGGHFPEFIDIDCDHANPQMCCLYSSVIYTNLRAAELLRRPSSNFMETVQRDITHNMRGILIDWLIEVSDEYRLVPDTLYLGVYMIDRFLSQNYIERQRLQLVGITCMLIASKYEEICAPRAEEFCFITDNTYTKGEVLKMEIQVLNFLSFQLSVPTIKTFLRRFIRAAHASYKVPPKGLSHLANYLAELTLVEYSFLKFLPSAIAASAVFLARWTLDQSDHPWNATLEYYTSYKASDLETAVLAMHDLQMNFSNCPLNAIREKYKHQKFESVATMTSPKLIQSLFC